MRWPWIIAGVLLLAGCDRRPDAKGQSAPPPTATVPAPSAQPAAAARATDEELPKLDFAMATPTATPMELPARFANALAVTFQALEAKPYGYPPSPYVTARLCAGDRDMQQRLLVAWRAAAKAKASPLGYANDCEDYCRWAVGVAEDAREPTAVREAAAGELASCYAPLEEVKRVMGSPIAPADAVENWLLFASYQNVTPGYLPSMRRVLERGQKAANKIFGQRLAAVAVGHVDDPRIAKVLLDHHATLRDPALKRAVAYGMHGQSDDQAKKVFAAACKSKPAKEREPYCGTHHQRMKRHGLEAQVRDSDFDVEALVKAEPSQRPAVMAALKRCIAREPLDGEKPGAYEAGWCITKLARIDWLAARAAARAAGPDVGKYVDAAALVAFDSSAAMRQRLDALGWKLAATTGKTTPTTVTDAILQGGRAHHFDTETGTYPNLHDELMFELARLVDDELRGVVFVEIAPGLDSRADYRLEAYMDGVRYELPAENLGDWYDVEATLGLLNALLAKRKSRWRYGVVDTGGQDIIVIAAPNKTLARTVKEGLLPKMAEAKAAMEAGKAFEKKVFDQLGK